MTNQSQSPATDANVATEANLLESAIAATPQADVRSIWKGEDQSYHTYDGRPCCYSVPMLEHMLGQTYKQAPQAEKAAFLAYCIIKQLDPISRQVYFVKYDANAPASFVTDWMVFVDRAQRHPRFDGFESGIIWMNGKGETKRGKPCDHEPSADHRIFGGWAIAHRKDQTIPRDVEVPLSEMISTKRDGTPTRSWRKMLTTMATKTPSARALRQSFPEKLAGLYIAEEPQDGFDVPKMPPLESGDTAPVTDLDSAADHLEKEEVTLAAAVEPPDKETAATPPETEPPFDPGEQPATDSAPNDPLASWSDYQFLLSNAKEAKEIAEIEDQRVSHLPEAKRAEARKLANARRRTLARAEKKAAEEQSAKSDKTTAGKDAVQKELPY